MSIEILTKQDREELLAMMHAMQARIETLGGYKNFHENAIAILQSSIESAERRLSELESKPTPEPQPEPEPPTPPTPEPPPVNTNRIKVSDFKLIGGIRLKEEFGVGGLAIDFENGRIYQGGHGQKNDIVEYLLPQLGLGDAGANHNNWPSATFVRRVPKFWGTQPWKGMALRPNGLSVRNGKLWVSPRVFYNQGNGAENTMYIMAEDGETIQVARARAKFGGGFIKGHPEWLIGNGGYESGQGSVAGPTAAKIDGTILIDQPDFGSLNFNARTPRPSGYWPAGGVDTWAAMRPRDAESNPLSQEQALASEGVGAWCSDHVTGGGIWTPRGLCYWAQLGFGILDYKYQSEAFAANGMVWPFLYTYSPDFARESVQFEEWPYGQIHGCEVGPDGRIYLMRRNAWKSGMYQVDSAIYVFEAIR
jgi:hypothetical protein